MNWARRAQVVTAMWRIAMAGGGVARKRALFREFGALGGVYVKFLQVLGVSQQFMAGWAGPRERAIFEDAAFEPVDMDAELGAKQSYITYVDPEPFAAGSFAIVYRARLTSGDDVIIKVLRPSVRQYLTVDLGLLRFCAGLLQAVGVSSLVDMRQAYGELRRTVENEVDYAQEVAQAQWFYDYFAGHEHMVVPYTYADLSNDTLIVQQYVGGVSLAQVMKQQADGHDAQGFVQQATGSNIWQQMALVGTEFLKTALTADYVLADPHPGNIKLLPGGKVGLIDFGMVAVAPTNREPILRLTREYNKLFNDQFDLSTFTLAMMEYFDQRLVGCLDRASRQAFDMSILNTIAEYVHELLQDRNRQTRFEADLRERRMASLFNSVINEGNRFGIHADLQLLAVQRAMLMYMAMTGSICRPAGMNVYNSVVRASLATALAHIDIHGLPKSVQLSIGDDEAMEIAMNWLERIADKNAGLVGQIGAII